jgi:hypothetical protein
MFTISGTIIYSPIGHPTGPPEGPHPPAWPHSGGPPQMTGPPQSGDNHPWPTHPGPHSLSEASSTTTAIPPGSSGGLLIDTAPQPTAIRTYFVNGNPVVPGTPTVIQDTTYSVASSGTALYENGKPAKASHALIGGGGTTRTEAAAASSSSASSSSMPPSNGGAGVARGLEGRMAVLFGAVMGVAML